MGEIAVTVAKWALKISFFSSIAIALMILFGVLTSYLVAGFSLPVLTDVFAFVQVWLPFNLNVILIWLGLAATAYLIFRLSLMTFNIIDAYLR